MLGNRSPSWWGPWARRLALATAVAGGLTYLPYRVLDGPEAARLAEMGDELDRALLSTGKLRAENAELLRDISALKQDPRAIEEIARDELGMVFPDEVVIRVNRGRQ